MSQTNGYEPRRAQVAPRERQTDAGHDTAAPRRAASPPTHSVPTPTEPTKNATENHWRKHPSDYHADVATDAMIRAHGEPDSAKRSEHLAVGQINSNLALRDAILEHAAVMRDIRDGRKKA